MHVDRLYQLENQISQFAENFELYYRSLSTKVIGKDLQSSMNSLTNWWDLLKIKKNPNKI